MARDKANTHCFSVYFPKERMFELKLAQRLAQKTGKSVGMILRLLLKRALQDNGLLDKKGNSMVPGIQPPAKKRQTSLIKDSTSLKLGGKGNLS